MEAQTVRRRINTIAAHFSPSDEVSATHLLPMNCSSTLNSVVRRHDNRMLFARQGSASQASFMRQASVKEVSSANERVYNSSEPPLFSRPSRIQQNLPSKETIQNLAQGTVPEPPKFARTTRTVTGEKQPYSKKKVVYSSERNGIEWSPRMDIAETGCNYVITVELAGINIKDIRVEIDDKKFDLGQLSHMKNNITRSLKGIFNLISVAICDILAVKGKRSTQFWKVAGSSNDSISTYHKREILQGPYEVVWPLPPDLNKDSVSAEFLDGFLHVVIPKL